MKLSTIKQILDINIPKLELLKTINGSNNSYVKFDKFNIFKEAVSEIKKLDVFIKEVENLENLKFYNRETPIVELINSEAQGFLLKAKELINAAKILNLTLEKVISENDKNDQNSIFIKLPNTTDLGNLAQEIENFNKILTLTVLDPKIGGEITLELIEPGSIWLKINLGIATAVTLVGSIAWSSAVVYKKYQEAKIIEELVNQQKLENEQRQNALNASKLLTDLFIQAEAQNIYNTYYQNGEIDNEQIERIKASIKMLSEEIHKGAEIAPALTAPEEVTNLFPDMKALPLIQSKIKQIDKE